MWLWIKHDQVWADWTRFQLIQLSYFRVFSLPFWGVKYGKVKCWLHPQVSQSPILNHLHILDIEYGDGIVLNMVFTIFYQFGIHINL